MSLSKCREISKYPTPYNKLIDFNLIILRNYIFLNKPKEISDIYYRIMAKIESNKEKFYFSYTIGKYYIENVFIILIYYL